MRNSCLLVLDGMELQLGLALPGNPIMGFDLNRHVYEPKKVAGSDLWNRTGSCLSSYNNTNDKKKRSFDEAFEPLSLPLPFWNNQPNEEDDPICLHENSAYFTNKNDGDGIVGWPPVKYYWKKKLCYHNHGGEAEGDPRVENGGGRGTGGGGGGGGGGGSNSKYVKVKMEGVAIARKVDLSIHHSYETLLDTLISMFGNGQQNVKCYKLTYQDKEGDWLLAGDTPWRTFVRSTLRLKLLRTIG